MRNRTGDIRTYLEGSEEFEPVLCKLEDAFDPEWWRRMGKAQPPDNLGIDLQSEGMSTCTTSKVLPMECFCYRSTLKHC